MLMPDGATPRPATPQGPIDAAILAARPPPTPPPIVPPIPPSSTATRSVPRPRLLSPRHAPLHSQPPARRPLTTMVRLREIPRTATFAWSPGPAPPFLATGTKAGAVDADFSNDTQLELWALQLDDGEQSVELSPTASVSVDSRYAMLPPCPRPARARG